MAIDRKYGRVTLEHGAHIPDDEPVVVFRARDKLLPKVLAYYRLFCWKAGSPRRHLELIDGSMEAVELELIDGSMEAVERYQQEHAPVTPTSETSRAWMDDGGAA
jgi:hypothetical protein